MAIDKKAVVVRDRLNQSPQHLQEFLDRDPALEFDHFGQQQSATSEMLDKIRASTFWYVNKHSPPLLRKGGEKLSQAAFAEFTGQERGRQMLARRIILARYCEINSLRRAPERDLIDLKRLDIGEIDAVKQPGEPFARVIEREEIEQLARRARHRQLEMRQAVQQVSWGPWTRVRQFCPLIIGRWCGARHTN